MTANYACDVLVRVRCCLNLSEWGMSDMRWSFTMAGYSSWVHERVTSSKRFLKKANTNKPKS